MKPLLFLCCCLWVTPVFALTEEEYKKEETLFINKAGEIYAEALSDPNFLAAVEDARDAAAYRQETIFESPDWPMVLMDRVHRRHFGHALDEAPVGATGGGKARTMRSVAQPPPPPQGPRVSAQEFAKLRQQVILGGATGPQADQVMAQRGYIIDDQMTATTGQQDASEAQAKSDALARARAEADQRAQAQLQAEAQKKAETKLTNSDRSRMLRELREHGRISSIRDAEKIMSDTEIINAHRQMESIRAINSLEGQVRRSNQSN